MFDVISGSRDFIFASLALVAVPELWVIGINTATAFVCIFMSPDKSASNLGVNIWCAIYVDCWFYAGGVALRKGPAMTRCNGW